MIGISSRAMTLTCRMPGNAWLICLSRPSCVSQLGRRIVLIVTLQVVEVVLAVDGHVEFGALRRIIVFVVVAPACSICIIMLGSIFMLGSPLHIVRPQTSIALHYIRSIRRHYAISS